jgi:hypothetical protein
MYSRRGASGEKGWQRCMRCMAQLWPSCGPPNAGRSSGLEAGVENEWRGRQGRLIVAGGADDVAAALTATTAAARPFARCWPVWRVKSRRHVGGPCWHWLALAGTGCIRLHARATLPLTSTTSSTSAKQGRARIQPRHARPVTTSPTLIAHRTPPATCTAVASCSSSSLRDRSCCTPPSPPSQALSYHHHAWPPCDRQRRSHGHLRPLLPFFLLRRSVSSSPHVLLESC